jgi:hypothetical protein
MTVERFGIELDAHTNPFGERESFDLLDGRDRARNRRSRRRQVDALRNHGFRNKELARQRRWSGL